MTGSLHTRARSPAEVDRLLHDLGQPLAAIRALSWAPPGAGGEPDARLERIAELAEWMTALLELARPPGPDPPGGAGSTRPDGGALPPGPGGGAAPAGPAEGSGRAEVGAVVRDVVVAAAAVWDGALSLDPGASVVVPVDPVELRRAVANLVDNATRAGGRVDVRLVRIADRVRIEVADDGPGFGRLPRQTGHGLAVVLDLAARCGGLLRIGSGPGGGALIGLELPALGSG